MFTMADVTRTHAAERPEKTALICDDRTLTYGELHTESCRVAKRFSIPVWDRRIVWDSSGRTSPSTSPSATAQRS